MILYELLVGEHPFFRSPNYTDEMYMQRVTTRESPRGARACLHSAGVSARCFELRSHRCFRMLRAVSGVLLAVEGVSRGGHSAVAHAVPQ